MRSVIKKYQSNISKAIFPDITIGIRTGIVLAGVVVVFGFTIWLLNNTPSLQNIWEIFPFDKKIPASFCEKIQLNNPVRQPANTFSNIVYLVVAIIVFKTGWEERGKRNSHDLLTANTAYSFLFGFVLLYVFLASSFYHASLINLAHKLDYSSVFAFTLFPTMFFLHRSILAKKNQLHASQKKILTLILFCSYVLTVFLLSYLIPRGKESLAALVLIQIFLGLAFFTVINKSDNYGRSYLVLSVVSVLIALVFFEFDKYKILCHPNSYFQTHSLWNLFIGLSAFYFYLYIRSEPDSGALIRNMKSKAQGA